jgi:FixJ family two-component response regulator
MPTIYVVDDDEAIGESLRYLLQTKGYKVEHDRSQEQCLQRTAWDRPACLVIDLRLADGSGLELHRRLRETSIDIPTIMISGRAEITDAVQALKDGVLDFLTKPFDAEQFLNRVRHAIEQDEASLAGRKQFEELQSRFQRLTAREREVLICVLNGLPNKQIAVELGLSAKTVEFHRKHVMQKIKAVSVTELVRLATIVYPEWREFPRKPT